MYIRLRPVLEKWKYVNWGQDKISTLKEKKLKDGPPSQQRNKLPTTCSAQGAFRQQFCKILNLPPWIRQFQTKQQNCAVWQCRPKKRFLWVFAKREQQAWGGGLPRGGLPLERYHRLCWTPLKVYANKQKLKQCCQVKKKEQQQQLGNIKETKVQHPNETQTFERKTYLTLGHRKNW